MTLILCSCLMIAGCRSSEEKPPPEPSFEDLDAEAVDDPNLEDITKSVQESGNYPTPHPKDLEAWTLKSMLMTEEKPSNEDMVECRNELLSVGNSVINAADLLNAQEQLLAEVKQSWRRYHWCFYYSVMLIDSKLKSDALGKTLNSRLSNYHKEMKTLWIMASTLSKATSDEAYFQYLRKHYISTSEKYFARRLNITGKALGWSPDSSQGRPAGELDPADANLEED
ncbi:MAG: hypothetical protein HRU19_22850 [Pseudobacteriovorax sp.]|nr:hypothetical protein [Pseudobacteriovorax sp.]